MTINQKTLLLDVAEWDLVEDASGNIALATDPYSISQDVASALRTFQGECWYNTYLGVPYWQNILGQLPPMQFVKAKMEQQALTVPNTVRSKVEFTNFSGRNLQGQCTVTDTQNNSSVIDF